MMISQLKFRHWVVIIGFVIGVLYILASNKALPMSGLTILLSSKYCLYLACLLVGLGYFISNMESKERNHQTNDIAPGLGEKKGSLSHKSENTDFNDFSGGGSD